MAKLKKIVTDPLVNDNPITCQVLGVCSALAVTTSVETALVMSASLTFVITASNLVISLLRNYIPHKIRMIVELAVIATLVIVADQNPRCDPGVNRLRSRADLLSTASGKGRIAQKQAMNSWNHRRTGQNVGRLDGSVKWCDDPNSPSDDDEIYFGSLPNDEKKGRRMNMNDVFLLP